jgi:hypothetical protein
MEEALRERDERIEALEKKCGLYMRGLEAEEKDCRALEAENAALRQQVERLSAPVTDAELNGLTFQRYGTDEWVVTTETLSALMAARKGAA